MRKLILSPALPMAAIALCCSLAAPASAVSIDWVYVGDPANAAASGTCVVANCGSVSYEYFISKYEVTNSQYAEFLNAKAASDPLGLYNANMGSSGGITRSGVSGSFTYSVIAGRGNMPVNFVSFYDALRFVNWLHNGQGSGDTETGAYTLLGGTATPSNGTTIGRNPGATISLTSENEWFKAAYYNAATTSYFGYPAGTNTVISCSTPTATPNSANCGGAIGDVTDVGSYPGSPSPYGTFDQGGNVREWSDDVLQDTTHRISRGGPYSQPAVRTSTVFINTVDAAAEGSSDGIRLASPNGWPEDLTGAWEFTYECGGGFNGTRFFDVTGTAPNFSVTPDTDVCGSSQRGAQGIFAVTGCSFTPDPVDVTTDGSGGYSQEQATNSVMWNPQFTDPSCSSALIDETRFDFSVAGGVYFPASGVATSISGSVTFVGDLKYYSAVTQCGGASLTGVACTFDGRRNGVQVGTNQVVEPVEGVRVTLHSVLTPGKVYATILSEPTNALPGNFVFVEPALVYQITTSAGFENGAQVCLPYPDDPANGIVDGTTLTPLELKIYKNGVRQLGLVQGPGNSVCVEVTGFSEFALGFTAAPVPALSRVGLGLLLSVVSLAGIVLLRRRSAGA